MDAESSCATPGFKVESRFNADLLKLCGFGGLKVLDNPSNVLCRPASEEQHVFQFFELEEVKRTKHCACVHE